MNADPSPRSGRLPHGRISGAPSINGASAKGSPRPCDEGSSTCGAGDLLFRCLELQAEARELCKWLELGDLRRLEAEIRRRVV